jgi:hypothetical protein
VALLAGRTGAALELGREALHLAVTRKERGNHVYALWLLGTIAGQEGAAGAEHGQDYLRRAAALADELGMRSMRARCLLALGLWTGEAARARPHLAEAVALLRDMDMAYWLAGAEKALAALPASSGT